MNTMKKHGRIVLLATVVFVLALGGTASAAKLITGKHVKNGSLTSLDLGDASVEGKDLTDESLTQADFAEPVVGSPGTVGPEGQTGPRGPRGVPGASGLVYVTTPFTVAKGAEATSTADCPGNTRVLGGGFSSSFWASFKVLGSAPDIQGGSWVVTTKNGSSQALPAFAWAVCAFTS
jgi:hypothetical protein